MLAGLLFNGLTVLSFFAIVVFAPYYLIRFFNQPVRDPSLPRYLAQCVMLGAIVGFTGFAIGFFGPIMWAPDANQGPLLGIFITGPIGVLVGVALTWVWLFRAMRRQAAPGA